MKDFIQWSLGGVFVVVTLFFSNQEAVPKTDLDSPYDTDSKYILEVNHSPEDDLKAASHLQLPSTTTYQKELIRSTV